MLRLGLCCTFREADIRFRHTTARYAATLPDTGAFVLGIAMHDAHALRGAVEFCAARGIGAFRVPPNAATVAASLRELEYQAKVAELIGAEQLTLHGGGAQDGKPTALARLATNLTHLSARARQRVVLIARAADASEPEVAARLGITLANVKIRAHRGRKHMRAALERALGVAA